MDNKKKTRALLLYLGIPIIVILAVTFLFANQPHTDPVKTSEIVGYFEDGKVSDY